MAVAETATKTPLAIDLSLVLLAITAALSTVILTRSSGPVLWDDEGTYLWVAAGLARLELWPQVLGSSRYAAGYSVLVAPVAFVFGQGNVYEAALTVNAIALAVLGLSARRLATFAFGLGNWQAFSAAAIAVLYPANLLQLTRAWPEIVLSAIFTTIGLLAFKFAANPGRMELTAVAAVGVLSYTIHHRTAPLLLLPLLLIILGGRWRLDRLLVAVATPAIGLTVAGFLDGLVLQPESAASRSGSVVTAAADVGNWLDIFAGAVGQLWAIEIGSMGLALVGIWSLVVSRYRSWGLALALVIGGHLFLAASFLVGTRQVDAVFYGRYLDFVVPLLVVAAVGFLFTRGSDAVPVVLGASIVPAVGLPLVRLVRLDGFDGGIIKARIPGLLAADALLSDFGSAVTLRLDAIGMTVMLLTFAIVCALLLMRGRTAEVVGITLILFASFAVVAARWSFGGWLNITEPVGAALAADLAESVDSVGVVPSFQAANVANAVAYQSNYAIQPQAISRYDLCPDFDYVLNSPRNSELAFGAMKVSADTVIAVDLYKVERC